MTMTGICAYVRRHDLFTLRQDMFAGQHLNSADDEMVGFGQTIVADFFDIGECSLCVRMSKSL